MAQITLLRPPSVSVVMASAAKLSFPDVCHEYIVGTGAHFETDFTVAYIAFEADAVKPVRKDHRAHSSFFRSLVEYYITIFCKYCRWNEQREQSQQNHPIRESAEQCFPEFTMVFHSTCLTVAAVDARGVL